MTDAAPGYDADALDAEILTERVSTPGGYPNPDWERHAAMRRGLGLPAPPKAYSSPEHERRVLAEDLAKIGPEVRKLSNRLASLYAFRTDHYVRLIEVLGVQAPGVAAMEPGATEVNVRNMIRKARQRRAGAPTGYPRRTKQGVS